jgi:hypothetical protein
MCYRHIVFSEMARDRQVRCQLVNMSIAAGLWWSKYEFSWEGLGGTCSLALILLSLNLNSVSFALLFCPSCILPAESVKHLKFAAIFQI